MIGSPPKGDTGPQHVGVNDENYGTKWSEEKVNEWFQQSVNMCLWKSGTANNLQLYLTMNFLGSTSDRLPESHSRLQTGSDFGKVLSEVFRMQTIPKIQPFVSPKPVYRNMRLNYTNGFRFARTNKIRIR